MKNMKMQFFEGRGPNQPMPTAPRGDPRLSNHWTNMKREIETADNWMSKMNNVEKTSIREIQVMHARCAREAESTNRVSQTQNVELGAGINNSSPATRPP